MNNIYEKFIEFVCKQSLRRPLVWLLASIIISVPFVMQFSHIGLDTDLIRLLPKDSRSAKMKKQVDQVITGSSNFFTILLESNDKEKLREAVDATVAKTNELEGIGAVEYKYPVKFYDKFRYALIPSEFLDQVLDFFIRLESKVNPMGEDLLSDEEQTEEEKEEQEKKDKEDIKQMMRYLDLPEYHQSEDGTVMAVKVFPQKGVTSLGSSKRLYVRLQKLAKEIEKEYGVWIGIGGSLRSNLQQYDFIINDLSRSGMITFILVILALIVGFRSIRILPVVLLPLFMGLAWTMGAIPMLVGDLNTITSFLLLVSFGLGIDFSLHLVKRYQHELNRNTPEQALMETFKSTGKSILVSGLTTTLAMFILAFSNFRGFSEFGIVGGFSLIMILLAMLLFLPSVCVLGQRMKLVRKLENKKKSRTWVPGPAVTIAVLVLIVVSLVLGVWKLYFNYDFSKMEARVQQEQEVRERYYKVYESGRSPAAVLIGKGLDSQDEIVEVLEKSKEKENTRIQRFHHIRDLFPDDGEFQDRLDMIEEIKDIISGKWVDRVEDEDYKKWIDDMRVWTPPSRQPKFEELPEDVRNRFSSRTQRDRFVVPVYIEGEKQKGKNAMAFSDELNGLKYPPDTIGPFGETTVLADVLRIVTSEGPWLVAVTFLGIFIIILLGQRSLGETLWILIPLATGMILTMGIMVLIPGLSLNFFNVVVFPSLIGMGVDDGVHYYRRWRELKMNTTETQRELFGPLTLTSITTIFGYIGIAFSNHPGLQSIGILACIGLAAAWFTSLFLLPGLLNFFSKRSSPK